MIKAYKKTNENSTKLINELKLSSTLYPPLNKDQERDLINRYRHDREKLNLLLVMHNIKFVFDQSRKYASKTNDYDNLIQEGMKGLAIAASRFDINKNIKFCTYAVWWIRKYILATFYGRLLEIDKNSISIDAPIATSSSNNDRETAVENLIVSQVDPNFYSQDNIIENIELKEQHDIYKKLLKSVNLSVEFSDTDKSIFRNIFIDNMSIRNISNRYNISSLNILKIKSKILNFLRNKCKNELNYNFS